MKLLFVADIHIKLGQRKVPADWQRNRVMLLADKINKHSATYGADCVVIGGDLLDVPKPSVDEVALMLDFLDEIVLEKLVIPGNHEMVSKKKDCFLPLDNQLAKHYKTKVVRDFDTETLHNIDIIPYNVLHSDFKPQNSLAITHVRGEIPPHVEPEVDLDKFKTYTKVFAGDLHSHTNSQANLLYPGSPFTTSFHRKPSNKGTTGLFLLDTETLEHEWIQLDLPELLRYTVDSEEGIVEDAINNVIYEVTGELEDLAKIKDSHLIDKKVANNISLEATLELDDSGTMEDEVAHYLEKIKDLPSDKITRIVNKLKELGPINDNN